MIAILSCIAALAMTCHASCSHNTHLAKRAEQAQFGYLPNNGPLVWHKLSANFSTCRTGSNQSPVNIDAAIQPAPNATTLALIESNTFSANAGPLEKAKFENLGTTLEVIPEGTAGTVKLANTTYTLKQFHFHTPSEHRINGEYFPMEMHMVHSSPDEKLLVLAIPMEVTAFPTNNFLTQLGNFVQAIKEPGQSIDISGRDLSLEPVNLLIRQSSLAKYSGSLTTPPCAEGVTFVVSRTPMDVWVETYKSFKSVMKFNSRILESPPGSPNIIEMASGPVAAPVPEASVPPAPSPPVVPASFAIPPKFRLG